MKKNKVIQITKGRDSYLDITPLSDYCGKRGWRIVKEIVTIEIPKGRSLKQLLKEITEGKIRVVEPRKEING